MHSWKSASPFTRAVELAHSLLPTTRIHPWPCIEGHPFPIFLKRDDECRPGITAGKLRKYASLLPHLRAQGVTEAVLVGSANSNHVLAASLLLREAGMRPWPLLKAGATEGTNQALLRLVVPAEDWQVVERADWRRAMEIAENVADGRRKMGATVAVIPEGGNLPAAIPGAAMLAWELVAQLAEAGTQVQDVFVDAGTGLSAAALAMGLHAMGERMRVHVTLLADKPAQFWEKAQVWEEWFGETTGLEATGWQGNVVLHAPVIGRRYGSVDERVMAAVERYAHRGVLTDPIYSAKHLATAEAVIADAAMGVRSAVIIHSGGAQALPGFL